MILTVASGKGGTGKTTVTASLAQMADGVIIADNDVDAADLHLLLKPRVREVHDFQGGSKAVIDPDACTACGLCANSCHFGAVRVSGAEGRGTGATYFIDRMACEGCELCRYVCPSGAITMHKEKTGVWRVSGTACGPMVDARLGIAQENSGKLVSRVRERAAQLAGELHHGLVLADGPPGTSCPVIASVTGADLVLIVTEPTVSGVHDLERVLELTNHFGVPAQVLINKADLNREQAQRIHQPAKEAGARVTGEIPFDHNVHDALMNGQTVLEYGKGPARTAIMQAGAALRETVIGAVL